MVTLDKGSPWHPLVVSIRGWTFPGRFAKGMDNHGGMITVGIGKFELRGGGIFAALKKMKEEGVAAAVEAALQSPPPEDADMLDNNVV